MIQRHKARRTVSPSSSSRWMESCHLNADSGWEELDQVFSSLSKPLSNMVPTASGFSFFSLFLKKVIFLQTKCENSLRTSPYKAFSNGWLLSDSWVLWRKPWGVVRLADCDVGTELVALIRLRMVFQSYNRSAAGKVRLCLALGKDRDFQRIPEPRGQVQCWNRP